jgi:hypothetical protein
MKVSVKFTSNEEIEWETPEAPCLVGSVLAIFNTDEDGKDIFLPLQNIAYYELD